MKKNVPYQRPEFELLTVSTLKTLAQSVTDPNGTADDFNWDIFED